MCRVFTLEESRENEPSGPTNRPTNLRAFSHDVMFAILVFQNIKMAAMLVFQTNPVGANFSCEPTLLAEPLRSFLDMSRLI